MKHPSGAFYRHVLAEAWSVVRSSKMLWVFGFFVSFLGNGGVYELLVQGTGRLGLQQDFGGAFALIGVLPSEEKFAGALEAIGAYSATIYLLLAVTIVALLAVAVWVVVSSQGGLIAGIRDRLKGRALTFRGSFASGNEVFWPLLTLNMLSRLTIMALFYLLLALLLLLLTKVTLVSSLLYLVGFLILIPLTLIVGFVTVYAACYVVLQRLRFVEALESALALFRKYWLISLETAAILFGINIAVAFGIGAAMSALGLAILPFVVGASLVESGPALGVLLSLAVVLGVLVLAVVGSGLAAFQYATWVVLFNKLHVRGHGASSKLARWFQRLLN